ncbi:cobalamin biosynthesis protein CobD [Catenovulum sp. SM1970]|uniref:adenosylcobinamide-phosphate synthase CbiB n=1 Tax=Marinifaba aquimaris TaxID=2741323 RepID=UPI001572322B|nr:adenosylcobinamide-phosphate synthase CbiB [Marinifaba aquimaris]NTS76337.1 cobalamin biosynthesis protein CobD [Marinifaba aquimaris]
MDVIAHYQTFLVVVLALLLDKIFAEPKRFHPLVGFGNLAIYIEKRLNRFTYIFASRFCGVIAWLILVLPLPVLCMWGMAQLPLYGQIIISAVGLYAAIGLASLKQHGLQVYQPLTEQDLTTARHFTGYLVSRETAELTPDEMARATTESMLENGHDAVIASLVCFVIGGLPLVIAHRLANTLDAMWGYKNQRFIHFGWAAARLDDLLGFVSGKVCTLLYAIQGLFKGRFLSALSNAMTQGNQYKSHNGGWVMAAGATVLNIKLGGSAIYHGQIKHSVELGQGEAIDATSIKTSIELVERAAFCLCGFLWLALVTQFSFSFF